MQYHTETPSKGKPLFLAGEAKSRTSVGTNHYESNPRQSLPAKAERIVAEGLRHLGWPEKDLRNCRKGDRKNGRIGDDAGETTIFIQMDSGAPLRWEARSTPPTALMIDRKVNEEKVTMFRTDPGDHGRPIGKVLLVRLNTLSQNAKDIVPVVVCSYSADYVG